MIDYDQTGGKPGRYSTTLSGRITAPGAITWSIALLVRRPAVVIVVAALVASLAATRLADMGVVEGSATLAITGGSAVLSLVCMGALWRFVALEIAYVDGSHRGQLWPALRAIPALVVTNVLIAIGIILVFFLLELLLSNIGVFLVGIPLIALIAIQTLLIPAAIVIEGRFLEGIEFGWNCASDYRLQILGLLIGLNVPLGLIELRLSTLEAIPGAGDWVLLVVFGVLAGVFALSLGRVYVDGRL